MYIEEETLDDLLRKLFKGLLDGGTEVKSSRGNNLEITGVLLKLSNPRARLSLSETRGRIFSALGELFWYLSKTASLEFIKYYIDAYKNETEDGATIFGAYGPRLFDEGGINQWDNVFKLLKKKPNTRKAVIQLFQARDLAQQRKEIPCTCTLQFLVREAQLNLIVTMRSNDAFMGLPHDIFSFTMLQEIMAKSLKLELGEYSHFVGSMHLYVDDRKNKQNNREDAKLYLEEGFHDYTFEMPPMPEEDPWPSIENLLRAEKDARNSKHYDENLQKLKPYWQDLARMFWVFAASKERDEQKLKSLSKQMQDGFYSQYIDTKIEVAAKSSGYQMDLNI